LRKVERAAVEGALRPREERIGLRGAPAAVGAVAAELLLDVGARQGLVLATADVGLSFFKRRTIL
jgi:hypothetical protein